MPDLDPIEPRNALELYLADKEGTLSQSSIRSHRWRVSAFVDWLDERGITNMNELTGRLVKEYQLEGRKANDWAPSTEKSMMTTIRVFIRWCEGIEAVESGLSERVQPPTISGDDDVRDEQLDAETAQEVLKNLDRFHYCSRPHVTLAVMWHTMARCGAVRSLDLADYDAEKQSLRFTHRPETETPLKNKQTSERHVAISESLADLLDDWIELKSPDVTDEYGRDPLITTTNGRIAKGTIAGYAYKYTQPCRYKRRCPLDRNPEMCESTDHGKASSCPESVSPHPFRRGSITHWLRSDVPTKIVSDRADVSEGVIDKHYDERTDQEKMEQRREYLENV
ncbi:site-specific integrase [Halobacterium salinarum]|uniref:tyrosine-type recombinase/integrase n=1 Tax=Halobacterium salinarum TaxID=2242 RepID=UPI0025570979|nr:site-specific integrase [Halobacterium salinarum]MDL0138885.1 site-specific integrase [Halobacterium salinarum]